MGVNSLPETVTRQRRDCDLNQGPIVPESSTLTTRLPSHPSAVLCLIGTARPQLYRQLFCRVARCELGISPCVAALARMAAAYDDTNYVVDLPTNHQRDLLCPAAILFVGVSRVGG